MEILLRILYTVLVLGVLIFIHELGHFIAAKSFGVRVTEFALGMGPALFKKQGKETLYALRLFPIGGYCAMTGEDEEMPDDPRALRSKPLWQRMIVVAAGAMMNLLLGILLISLVTVFKPIPSTTVAEFTEEATSLNYGLAVGDKIVAVNGTKVSDYTSMIAEFSRSYNKDTLSLTVLRDEREVVLPAVTFPVEQLDGDMSYPAPDFRVYRQEKTVGVVVESVLKETWSYCTLVFNTLGDLITGKVPLKYVSGPIGMSSVISDAASYGWATLCTVAAIISVNLCVMNLLPLPALDGGRLLFMFVELIIRRPVPAKAEGIIHAVGLVILFGLMIVIAFKDLFFPIG